MNTLKNKIINSIAEPAAKSRDSSATIATVTYSNEKLNLCSIKFIDKDCNKSNINNVAVQLFNEGMIDWFPQIGDQVSIKGKGSSYVITGKASGEYSSGIRSQNKLKKDVLPTSFIDTMCGMLF